MFSLTTVERCKSSANAFYRTETKRSCGAFRENWYWRIESALGRNPASARFIGTLHRHAVLHLAPSRNKAISQYILDYDTAVVPDSLQDERADISEPGPGLLQQQYSIIVVGAAEEYSRDHFLQGTAVALRLCLGLSRCYSTVGRWYPMRPVAHSFPRKLQENARTRPLADKAASSAASRVVRKSGCPLRQRSWETPRSFSSTNQLLVSALFVLFIFSFLFLSGNGRMPWLTVSRKIWWHLFWGGGFVGRDWCYDIMEAYVCLFVFSLADFSDDHMRKAPALSCTAKYPGKCHGKFPSAPGQGVTFVFIMTFWHPLS